MKQIFLLTLMFLSTLGTKADDLSPQNDYPGLQSLIKRLELMNNQDSASVNQDSSFVVVPAEAQPTIVSFPLYFFFRMNTTKLICNSQLLNLDSFVNIAKTHNLRISVCGSADSATGSPSHNEQLSWQRVQYIVHELLSRGIDESMIVTSSNGGSDEYPNPEHNRNVGGHCYSHISFLQHTGPLCLMRYRNIIFIYAQDYGIRHNADCNG